MKRQLSAMTLKQLQAHYDLVKELLETRKLKERKLAAAIETKEAARRHGFELSELIDVEIDSPKKRKRKSRKPIAKVPFKYQNPSDNSQKWTGRGRSPIWVVKHVEAGRSMDELLIPSDTGFSSTTNDYS